MSATVSCSRCSTLNPATARFCGNCGTALATRPLGVVCPACGFAENKPPVTFCGECGQFLGNLKEARRRPRRLLAAALLLLLALAITVTLWWARAEEASRFDLFLDASSEQAQTADSESAGAPVEVILPSGSNDSAEEEDLELPSGESPQPEIAVTAPTATPSVTPSPTASPTPTITPSPTTVAGPQGQLLFVSDRDGFDSLYTVDVAQPQAVRRLTVATGYDWWPSWCGNTQIAFERTDRWPRASSQEIALLNVNDGEPTLLTSAAFPAGSDLNGLPSCSPDGNLLAFSSHAISARATNEFRLGITDRRSSDLTFNLVGDGYPLAGNASWSPAGDELAFMHYQANAKRFSIYRVSLAGNGLDARDLTPNDDSSKYPDWSPQGDQIAFACVREEGDDLVWGLCLIGADGSSRQRVLDELHRGPEQAADSERARHAVTPSWSPDGRWIAVASDRDGNWDIWLYELSSGDLQNVTAASRADEIHPEWGAR